MRSPNKKVWFAENPDKIPENLGKNSAQRYLTSKNGARATFGEKQMKTIFYLEVTPKKVFMIIVGENL